MFKLDLPRLERAGTLEISAEIPADDPLWEGSDLGLRGPLQVQGTASLAGSGEVLVKANIRGELEQECRRCLKAVLSPVDLDVLLVFGATDAEWGDDGEIRPLDPEATELNVGEAVREELILNTAPYVLCDENCRGLCPRCGVDRNAESCECTLEEPDPRWDALRGLKTE
ncbi:MAG: DUF177 domain-containing protein [Gemmatimonadales bacterium]|nr:MAG: DUF177 domain-containing protein [Gemmatimonadales bacterium]